MTAFAQSKCNYTCWLFVFQATILKLWNRNSSEIWKNMCGLFKWNISGDCSGQRRCWNSPHGWLCSSVVEVFHLLGRSALSMGSWSPVFWDNLVVVSSRVGTTKKILFTHSELVRTWWRENSCLCQKVGLKSSSLEPVILLTAVPVSQVCVKQITADKGYISR